MFSRLLTDRRGLTFVELLVAATMFALLSVGLSYQLRGGITVWRRTQADTAQTQQVRMLLDTLERDCRHARLVDPTDAAKPKPEFLAQRLSLITLEPPREGAAGAASLIVATYRLDGGGQAQALVRDAQPLADAMAGGSTVRTMEMLGNVSRLELRYAQARAAAAQTEPKWVWKERWQAAGQWRAEDGLPRSIELTLEQAGGSAQAGPSAEPVALQVALTLPAGALKKEPAP